MKDNKSSKESFDRIKELIRPCPELDYDKELEEWRNEKFEEKSKEEIKNDDE